MIIKRNKNVLTAYGTIWSGDGKFFVEELSRIESEYDTITVHLHTYGGSVFDGNLIYNALNKSNSSIHIVIDGIVASMGAIIILSAQKVSIVENGYIMIHAPSSYSSGQAQDFENQAKLLRSIEKNFIEKLSARTGKSQEAVKKWLVGDNWFDAQEAKNLGLVTDVIATRTATLMPIENPSEMQPQDVFNAYACLLANLQSSNPNTEIKMKQLLIQTFALVGVTEQSSDTVVIEAVKNLLDTEKQARETAENVLNKHLKEQITAIISNAVKNGQITSEQQSVFEKIGETSGVEALTTVLQATSKQTPVNIADVIKKKQAGEVNTAWDFDQWQEKDPKGLEKMSVEDPEKFTELFNQKYKK